MSKGKERLRFSSQSRRKNKAGNEIDVGGNGSLTTEDFPERRIRFSSYAHNEESLHVNQSVMFVLNEMTGMAEEIVPVER